MNGKAKWTMLVALAVVCGAHAQGFVNLDFEDAVLVPIPGDPYGRVQWTPAMPGWNGYLGANQIDWLLYNNLFLSNPGIAIWGPNKPPGVFEGSYYIVMQAAFPVPSVGPAIAQSGMLPENAHSILIETGDQFALGFLVTFGGERIQMIQIGTTPSGQWIWGGDISQFAGQTGELRFYGAGYLDNIQFSSVGIPEPNALSLFGLGLLVLGWSRVVHRGAVR